jgi:uncharacterized protein YlxW (UPF0749 family)
MSKKKAKKISLQSFLIILGIGFGVLVSAQFRSLPARVINPATPYISLKDTKEELYSEQSNLKDTIKSLQSEIEKSQQEAKNISLSEDELKQLQAKKAQAGLTKLSGPGVIVNLDDSKTNIANEDSIIHAADLRDTVNILWSYGAEAISINDQRVVLNTAIDCIVNTILINNERIAAPYHISAIGPKDIMSNAVANQLQGLEKRKTIYALNFDIIKSNSIIVPAFDGSFSTKVGN